MLVTFYPSSSDHPKAIEVTIVNVSYADVTDFPPYQLHSVTLAIYLIIEVYIANLHVGDFRQSSGIEPIMLHFQDGSAWLLMRKNLAETCFAIVVLLPNISL